MKRCQKELLYASVDGRKHMTGFQEGELRYCMRESRVTEKYVRLMHDMYKASAMTVTRSDSASGAVPHFTTAELQMSAAWDYIRL